MAAFNALVLGAIVTFKGDYYVALGLSDKGPKGSVKIIAPHYGQAKLSVNRENVTVVDATPLSKVTHKGSDYLVSRKGTIISLTTNKVMRWADGNGNRTAILALAA